MKQKLINILISAKRTIKASNLNIIKVVFLISITVSIPITVYLAERGVFSISKAAVSAAFSFSPNSFIVPGDKTISLLVNTGTQKVGFAQAEIKFDQGQIKIANFTPGTKLMRILSQTTVSSANQTGTFRLSVGLEPSSYSTAPSGTFEIGRFTFSANTSSPNVSRTITQDTANSQVVSLGVEKATVSPASAQVIINPQVSCSSISIVDTIVTGTTYDRVRMRIKNNSSQIVYLTGSKISWASSQAGLTLDWFSWGNNQYYAGDSTTSPTTFNPTGVLVLPAGTTGSWVGRFKKQPITGLKGTFTPELNVNLSCRYTGNTSR